METGSSLYKFNVKLMAAMEYSALMNEVLHLLLAQKTLPIPGSQEQLIEWLGTIQVHRKGLDPPHCSWSSDLSKNRPKPAMIPHPLPLVQLWSFLLIQLPLTTQLNLQTLQQTNLIINSNLKQVARFLSFPRCIPNFDESQPCADNQWTPDSSIVESNRVWGGTKNHDTILASLDEYQILMSLLNLLTLCK